MFKLDITTILYNSSTNTWGNKTENNSKNPKMDSTYINRDRGKIECESESESERLTDRYRYR